MSDSETRRQSQAVTVMAWLAVKGMATRTEIEGRWGASDTVRVIVHDFISEGYLTEDGEYLYLSDRGSEAFNVLCRESLSESEQPAFEEFGQRFATLDRELKRIATEWQSIGGARVDRDDERVLDVLGQWVAVNDGLRTLIENSPAVVGQVLNPYTSALSAALTRFLDGDRSAFTGIDDATYHSTWFVMHEVILRTAGQSR